MNKLLPLLLILLGIGSGVGAGFMLKPEEPAPDAVVSEADPGGEVPATASPVRRPALDPATREYVKLNNQFIIPVVRDDRIAALVVLSLSLEVGIGQSQTVFAREPKLRDAFLQVLFDHANMGGFSGAFTETTTMNVLRRRLHEEGIAILGEDVTDILITDIARQDV